MISSDASNAAFSSSMVYGAGDWLVLEFWGRTVASGVPRENDLEKEPARVSPEETRPLSRLNMLDGIEEDGGGGGRMGGASGETREG